MARCGLCGADNPYDARFCLKCGRALGAASVPGKCAQCGLINAFGAKKCEGCGAPVSDSAQLGPPLSRSCIRCGKPAIPGQEDCWECSRRQGGAQMDGAGRGRSDALTVAAVLLVIAGALTIVQGVYMTAVESMIVGEDAPSSLSFVCCGFLEIIFGIVAIAGGYTAYKRASFLLSVAGCLVAMAGIALLLLGPVLGIIALVLVVMNRSDF